MFPDKPPTTDLLSDRQKEILRLVNRHYRRKEIARLLGVSDETIKSHLVEARRRLSVTTTRDAAALLAKNEEIQLDDGGYPSRVISETAIATQTSEHEQASISSPNSNDKARTESLTGSLHVIGPTGKVHDGRGDTGSPLGNESGIESGEVRVQLHSGVGIPDGQGSGRAGWDEFRRRLDGLTATKRLGLIVLIAIALGLIVGGLISTATGVLWAFRHMLSNVG